MVSSASVPWYNRPPREFPVHVWMRRALAFACRRCASARKPTSRMGRARFRPRSGWSSGRLAADYPPRNVFVTTSGYIEGKESACYT